MALTGKTNGLTDVAGLRVGHVTDLDAASGTTVVLCPEETVAAVDVRGAAPGTRETDLLAPENLVQTVQAVVLSGGSVYGLAAADGVVRWLAERGRGFPLGDGQVAPIVPAAVLYDLGRGSRFVPPVDAEWGRRACEAAGDGPVATGCVGAGTGAAAGGIKGGLGTASIVLESGVVVAALVAANPGGSVVDPDTGRPWEVGREIAGEFGAAGRRAVRLPAGPPAAAGRNTTLGVVATDAALTRVQALKVAQMAHDGLARAVRPAHTMFDGDTIFALSLGDFQTDVNVVGAFAAEAFAAAILRAVQNARPAGGLPALSG